MRTKNHKPKQPSVRNATVEHLVAVRCRKRRHENGRKPRNAKVLHAHADRPKPLPQFHVFRHQHLRNADRLVGEKRPANVAPLLRRFRRRAVGGCAKAGRFNKKEKEGGGGKPSRHSLEKHEWAGHNVKDMTTNDMTRTRCLTAELANRARYTSSWALRKKQRVQKASSSISMAEQNSDALEKARKVGQEKVSATKSKRTSIPTRT